MTGTHLGLIFLELRLPNRPLTIAGVVLHDDANEAVVIKMRDNWHGIADADDEEVLADYEHGLVQLANDLGAKRFLEYLTSNFANAVSVSLEYTVNRPEGDLDQYAAELLRQLRCDIRPVCD
jgi:hypothetical protein